MYSRRQSLQEFRETEYVKQQNEALKLQAFALQQKNLASKDEIAKEQEKARALSGLVTTEKRKAQEMQKAEQAAKAALQEMQKAEQAAKAALQEKEAKARELAVQVESERNRAQKALDGEQMAKSELQSKTAQMDKLMAQVNSLTGQLGDVQTRAGKLQIEQEDIKKELRSARAQTQAQTPQIETAKSAGISNPNQGARYVVLSSEVMESRLRHVPYVFEITAANRATIIKDSVYYYYVENDESRGLGSPGRSGYIKNDGPGDITYRLYDKVQDTWSYPAVIRAGEADKFEYTDNIRVNTVEIIPDSNGTMFRLRFTAGIENVVGSEQDA
jgi:multidrug efflux pump subunit AcrA (membrane-fusion protein)